MFKPSILTTTTPTYQTSTQTSPSPQTCRRSSMHRNIVALQMMGVGLSLARCRVGNIDITVTRRPSRVHVAIVRTLPNLRREQRLLEYGFDESTHADMGYSVRASFTEKGFTFLMSGLGYITKQPMDSQVTQLYIINGSIWTCPATRRFSMTTLRYVFRPLNLCTIVEIAHWYLSTWRRFARTRSRVPDAQRVEVYGY